MHALPLDGDLGSFGLTAISCPSCPGVLVLSREGAQGFLVFRCRIGHLYSADELVRAKEERLEALQWAGITARDELAALLEDFACLEADVRRRAILLDRARRARADLTTVRSMVESEEPWPSESGGPES